jgi:hypothetical protein
MNAHRYTNVLLTINALLLAALLWVLVVERPLFADTAEARVVSSPLVEKNVSGKQKAPVFANATAQRQEIIAQLKRLNAGLAQQKSMLESGRIRVEVANLDEIEVVIEDDNRR